MIISLDEMTSCEGGGHVNIPVIIGGVKKVFCFHMENIKKPLSPEEEEEFVERYLRVMRFESKETMKQTSTLRVGI